MRAQETSGAPARERPLSPHLTIYQLSRYTLLTSISNRAAGIVLSLGQLLFVYWLVAVAGGERTYARASALLDRPLVKVVYAVLLAAFAYHLLAGIRHLIWDTGRGLAREQSRRSAWWVMGLSVLLALGLLAWGFLGRTTAP